MRLFILALLFFTSSTRLPLVFGASPLSFFDFGLSSWLFPVREIFSDRTVELVAFFKGFGELRGFFLGVYGEVEMSLVCQRF